MMECESDLSRDERSVAMERARSAWFAALALVLATSSLTAAASTPLEIHPPEGFTARQSSPDVDETTTYEVTTASDPDTGCTIDVTPAKGTARRSQDAINAEAATPGHRDGVKASLTEHFDVKDIDSSRCRAPSARWRAARRRWTRNSAP